MNFRSYSTPKNALCQVWFILAQWFWRRSRKCEMFKDGLRDRRRATGDQKSSLEHSTKKRLFSLSLLLLRPLLQFRKVFVISQCSILCSKYNCIWSARIANQTTHYLYKWVSCVNVLFGDVMIVFFLAFNRFRYSAETADWPKLKTIRIYLSLTITMRVLLTPCII